MTLATLGVGSRLAGRYRLLEPIGSGGMGHIFRALDERLDREVAVKLLQPEADGYLGTEATAAEARVAARLSHPNLAQVFDVGAEQGVEYIVMELVRGQSLRELLRVRLRLRPSEVVRIGAQLADALAHVHSLGIVHCDVKPRNVMLTQDGIVKLLDFGIAQGSGVSRTLPAGEVRGSAAYLSPEQARADEPDGRSDIYALGAVLYELLAGRPPFVGPDLHSVIVQRLNVNPPRPTLFEPAIPAALERVVLRALARDPARRYQRAEDLRDALRAAGASLSRAAVPGMPMLRVPRLAARWSGLQPGLAGWWSGARPRVLLLAPLAILVAVAALAALSHASAPGPNAVSAEPPSVTPAVAPTPAPEVGGSNAASDPTASSADEPAAASPTSATTSGTTGGAARAPAAPPAQPRPAVVPRGRANDKQQRGARGRD